MDANQSIQISNQQEEQNVTDDMETMESKIDEIIKENETAAAAANLGNVFPKAEEINVNSSVMMQHNSEMIDSHSRMVEHIPDSHSRIIEHASDSHSRIIEHASDSHSRMVEHTTDSHSRMIEHTTDSHSRIIEHTPDSHSRIIEHTPDSQSRMIEHTSEIIEPVQCNSGIMIEPVSSNNELTDMNEPTMNNEESIEPISNDDNMILPEIKMNVLHTELKELSSPGGDNSSTSTIADKCFVCDENVSDKEARQDVFYTMLPRAGILLSNSLNKILRTNYIAPHSMRSPYICIKCFELFDELETAEEQARRLRTTILTEYEQTCEMYGELLTSTDKETFGVACQTEDFEEYDNRQEKKHIPDYLSSDEEVLDKRLKKASKKKAAPKTKSKPKTRGRSKAKPKPKSRKAKVKVKIEQRSDVEEDDDNYVDDVPEPEPELDDNISEIDDQLDGEQNMVDATSGAITGDDTDNGIPDEPLPAIKKKRFDNYKHPCDQCNRTFRRPFALRDHIQMAHLGINPYNCMVCQRPFTRRDSLLSHLLRVHDIANPEIKKDTIPEFDEFTSGRKSKKRNDSENNQTDGFSDDDDDDMDETRSTTSARSRSSKKKSNYVYSDGSDDDFYPDGGGQTDDSDFEDATPAEPTSRKRSVSTSSRGRKSRRKEKENIDSDVKVKQEDDEDVPYIHLGADGQPTEPENVTVKADPGLAEGIDSPKKKKKRIRNRPSRVGERATMPLVHACPQCGKKWRTVSELNAHIQTHSDLRPFVCEICGQGYKMRKALDIHVGMHNGVHPYTCDYCNKSFTQKVGLQKHLPIHTGYTRFCCDLCGKRFIHQKSFQIHKMVHSGEKNIKCSICGLAVLSKSHLKRHFRVHTGERPYECSICGKRFAEKYNLNAHQKIHDPAAGKTPSRKRPQKCTICNATIKKISLEQHWAEEHKFVLPNNNPNKDSSPPRSPQGTGGGGPSNNVIPQMIIDPSGGITYEETPVSRSSNQQHPHSSVHSSLASSHMMLHSALGHNSNNNNSNNNIVPLNRYSIPTSSIPVQLFNNHLQILHGE